MVIAAGLVVFQNVLNLLQISGKREVEILIFCKLNRARNRFLKCSKNTAYITAKQGWEFAHLIFERNARFLSNNERFTQKNEWFTHSLIFGERNERFAHTAHFLCATWANRSWSLIFGEWFAHIAHLIWAKWVIHSHRSPKKRKWAKMSDSLIFSIFF